VGKRLNNRCDRWSG